MIASNRSYMFGLSYVGTIDYGTIESPKHGCIVSAAPEGLFKGWSLVIQAFSGKRIAPTYQVIVAKAMMHPNLSRSGRADAHEQILLHLDYIGDSGIGLEAALNQVLEAAKEKQYITAFQLQAPT